MAESVDALVSNTSGATHPGSSPGLGTKKGEKFASLLFYCYNSCQTYFGSPKKFMDEPFTNDFIILQQSFRNSSNILLTYISPYCL